MPGYNIIDIEASGLDMESYPIEVAVLIEGKVYSWLIRPEPGWEYWDDAAEAIHGISREQLMQQGLSAKQVAIELNDCLGTTNGLLYSDAVQWDADWIRELYKTVDTIQEFHLLPIQDLFDEDEKKLFEQKRAEIASTHKYRLHRAGEDVQLISESMLAVFEEA